MLAGTPLRYISRTAVGAQVRTYCCISVFWAYEKSAQSANPSNAIPFFIFTKSIKNCKISKIIAKKFTNSLKIVVLGLGYLKNVNIFATYVFDNT